ncbi:hypothetical protein PoB_003107400 [Plakobranchus ocellatus]|uniref:Uncharacterized protein n=1 Tax=Plakobranchus ocellatus TaxID=259542 RepID=A0AAV4ADQ6_9GAST|nr:hypothetical protein PoB_003107400 [Plakobranchus ocellatus]
MFDRQVKDTLAELLFGGRSNLPLHHSASVSAHLLQQDNLRFPGTPSGQGIGGGARNCDRRVPAVLSTGSQSTMPPSPPSV